MSTTNSVILLTAATVDETTSEIVETGMLDDWSVTITVSAATFTSGTITIEGSDDALYAGTWAPLATASELAVVPNDAFSSVLATDMKLIISGADLAIEYIRVRVSDAIVGGATISATFWGRG